MKPEISFLKPEFHISRKRKCSRNNNPAEYENNIHVNNQNISTLYIIREHKISVASLIIRY